MLLSTGERVSMALLSMAIQKRGCDAISFTGSQSGIITNDRHFDAKIIHVRPHRVEDEIHRGRVVLIAGYQGMSYKREITTLGRGGSDTTALAMAAALGADRAEIYSDVDGVYSADPRVVDDARHLPAISYEEMQEMAEAGAKVLHAGAVEWARRAGVDIHARATFAPGRETVVSETSEEGTLAKSVVGQSRVAAVDVAAGGVALRAALIAAEAAGVRAFDVEAHRDHSRFLVATCDVPDWHRARTAIRSIEGVSIRDDLGAVTVVGAGFGRDPGLVVGALDALADAGIEPWRTSTTPLRLCALVENEEVDAAVRALHAQLVG
jgi:aspartate kinase